VSPRPRRSETGILDATIDVLAEHGVSGATVDEVAERAGVSKATIYRHWGSRARLIHAAISSLDGPYVEPDTGSLRDDLAALLRDMVEYLDRRDVGRVIPSVIDAATRDPELAALHHDTQRRARRAFERTVRRGIERGELPSDVDVPLLVDLVRSPFVYRRIVAQTAVGPDDIEPVIDLVLGAFSRVPT
jgi:AcrR family transcriptional regulator